MERPRENKLKERKKHLTSGTKEEGEQMEWQQREDVKEGQKDHKRKRKENRMLKNELERVKVLLK